MPSHRKKAEAAQSSDTPSNVKALFPKQNLIDATPRRRSLRLACCRKDTTGSRHTPVMERQDALKADSTTSATNALTSTKYSQLYSDSDEAIDVAEAQHLDEQLDFMEHSDEDDEDDDDERPRKRIRATDDIPNTAASASASAPASIPVTATAGVSTPDADGQQSTTACTSLSPNPHTTTDPAFRGRQDRSPPSHTQQAESAPKQSLVMTILLKSEVDSLKSHNGILRSHNLSLARQNANLRHDNANAILLYQEVQDMGPMDHKNCVNSDDYQRLLVENNKHHVDMAQLRYEHQLMKECSLEWARREMLWEIEERLLKTEVGELVGRVGELETTQEELYKTIKALEAKARIAEGTAEDEHTRATHLEQRLARAMAHTSCRNGRSSYPEL